MTCLPPPVSLSNALLNTNWHGYIRQLANEYIESTACSTAGLQLGWTMSKYIWKKIHRSLRQSIPDDDSVLRKFSNIFGGIGSALLAQAVYETIHSDTSCGLLFSNGYGATSTLFAMGMAAADGALDTEDQSGLLFPLFIGTLSGSLAYNAGLSQLDNVSSLSIGMTTAYTISNWISFVHNSP